MALNTYIRKEEKSQFNNLRAHPENQESSKIKKT